MIHTDNNRRPEDEPKQVIAADRSPHAILRKAINIADGDDSIVLSLESAMALITEFETGLPPLPMPV